MIKEIIHVGITVSDMDKSVHFYQNILGLKYQGELEMSGDEADILFGKKNCSVKVKYFNGGDDIKCPPVELIQFLNEPTNKDDASLFKTSISEICFCVSDIEKVYQHLLDHEVECISSPQYFDFSKYGFKNSKVLYFKDPDGIILELVEYVE